MRRKVEKKEYVILLSRNLEQKEYANENQN